MEYLEQLKAFDRCCEISPLPSSTQLIWYKLMSIDEKYGWAEWFRVDNKRLMFLTRISDEKTLIRNRNKLIRLGFIDYKRGKKGQPSQYRIKKLYADKGAKQ